MSFLFIFHLPFADKKWIYQSKINVVESLMCKIIKELRMKLYKFTIAINIRHGMGY